MVLQLGNELFTDFKESLGQMCIMYIPTKLAMLNFDILTQN